MPNRIAANGATPRLIVPWHDTEERGWLGRDIRCSGFRFQVHVHFPGPRNINNLTIGALDSLAKIPEYKVCAVVLEAVTEPESELS